MMALSISLLVLACGTPKKEKRLNADGKPEDSAAQSSSDVALLPGFDPEAKAGLLPNPAENPTLPRDEGFPGQAEPLAPAEKQRDCSAVAIGGSPEKDLSPPAQSVVCYPSANLDQDNKVPGEEVDLPTRSEDQPTGDHAAEAGKDESTPPPPMTEEFDCQKGNYPPGLSLQQKIRLHLLCVTNRLPEL